jgi:LPXTG-motif cell wall-anchored protein
VELTVSGIGPDLAPPASVKVVNHRDTGSVTVLFDAVAGATGYTVEYDTASSFTVSPGTASAIGINAVEVSGLTASTTYYFRVYAANAGGDGTVPSTAVTYTVTNTADIPFSLGGSNAGALVLANITIDTGSGPAPLLALPTLVSFGDIIDFEVAGLTSSSYYFMPSFGFSVLADRYASADWVDATPVVGGTYTVNVNHALMSLRAQTIGYISGNVLAPSTGTQYYTGSGSLSVNASYPASSLQYVAVNGTKIAASSYSATSVWSQSTVTLAQSYLQSLNKGTYTVELGFAGGSVVFSLVIPSDASVSLPATGDGALLPLGALGAAALCLGLAVVLRKRAKR